MFPFIWYVSTINSSEKQPKRINENRFVAHESIFK